MAVRVKLDGPPPWGFRIFGGRDFQKPITVSMVHPDGKANDVGMLIYDVILEINGENTADMLNVEARNKIQNSRICLELLVMRHRGPMPNGITYQEPLTARFQDAMRQDEKQNYGDGSASSPISLCSPDSPASPNGKMGRLTPTVNKSVQERSWSPEEKSNQLSRPLSQEFSTSDFRNNSFSSRTPTPPGRASPQSPIDRDVPMSPRRSSSNSDFAMQKFDRDSEVYKMIQENRESRSTPRQSNTFRMLQEVLEADEKEAALRFPGKLSPNPPKPTASVGGVSKHHTCAKCRSSILNQAVRITDDHYRHPECYTCTDCGLNLKMRGHFWIADVMYCEKHAKDRYHGRSSSP